MVALFERVTRGIRSRLLFLKSEERGSITVALQYEQFWAKELIHNPGLRWIGSRFKFAIELWNCNSAFFLEKNNFPRRAREKIKLYAEVELAVFPMALWLAHYWLGSKCEDYCFDQHFFITKFNKFLLESQNICFKQKHLLSVSVCFKQSQF